MPLRLNLTERPINGGLLYKTQVDISQGSQQTHYEMGSADSSSMEGV